MRGMFYSLLILCLQFPLVALIYVVDDVYKAVDLWLDDSKIAKLHYDHISNWDTSLIKDMSYLFLQISLEKIPSQCIVTEFCARCAARPTRSQPGV